MAGEYNKNSNEPEENLLPDQIESSALYYDYEPIKDKTLLEEIALGKFRLKNHTDKDVPSSEADFEDFYESNDLRDYRSKYRIARALIQDGRYADPKRNNGATVRKGGSRSWEYLSEKFISPEDQQDPVARDYQARLRLLLVEKGLIKEGSKEEKKAREKFAEIVLNDEKMKQLIEVLPIGFAGAIARIEFYKNITDPRERERMRAFTTKSLIRQYMGRFEYVKPTGQVDFKDVFKLIPEVVFSDVDEVTKNLAKHYVTKEVLKYFIEGEGTGFKILEQQIADEESPAKKEFLEHLLDEFRAASEIEIPPQFKRQIPNEADWLLDNESNTLPFPAFRQKYFVYEFLKTGRKVLDGDTGGTKTACSYLAMESLGKTRVTVFGPAKARDTWPEQYQKHLYGSNGTDIEGKDINNYVFVVKYQADLDNPLVRTAKYVYVSSELLSGASSEKNPEKAALLRKKLSDKLVLERGTDGIVLDEAHVFRNEDAQWSIVVDDIVAQARRRAPQGEIFPILALTATPIDSKLGDLNVPMSLVYPERFAFPGREVPGLHTFDSMADFNEETAFVLLYGEQLMMHWTIEDIFGDRVPQLDFKQVKRINIPTPPALKVIYDYVVDLSTRGMLHKYWLLRSALLNPDTIKTANSKENNKWYQSKASVPELRDGLTRYYQEWQEWKSKANPKIADQPFSADWIALQPGGAEFILECFFHENLAYGAETLAGSMPGISWHHPPSCSPKFEYIRQYLKEHYIKGVDGKYTFNVKTGIISPEHKEGITPDRYRTKTEAEIEEEDWGENDHTLYELILLHPDWLQGITRDQAESIDGTTPFSVRRQIAKSLRSEGNRTGLALMTLDSMNESNDMACRDTIAMANIDKFVGIYLGWPWGWKDFKQMSGRFIRPGLGKEVELWVLESEDSLEQGLYETVKRKYLLTEIALSGIRLDPEDADFFDRTKTAKKIIEVRNGNSQYYIRNALRVLRGAGEHALGEELARTEDGVSNFERWAQYYYNEGRDEFRTVGNNAELVSSILSEGDFGRILSVGAGTCLLNRKLVTRGYQGEVVNVDINPEVLRLAEENFPGLGEVRTGLASNLSEENESFDALDCSFMLDMTKLFEDDRLGILATPEQTERVKVLCELNRVLKTGGTAVITLAESALNEDLFGEFTDTLNKHFGLTLKEENNGKSFTKDLRPKRRLGWVITLEKTGTPDLQGLDLNGLFLLTDDRFGISEYKEKADPQGGVRVIEDPHFISKQFEVINPLAPSSKGTIVFTIPQTPIDVEPAPVIDVQPKPADVIPEETVVEVTEQPKEVNWRELEDNLSNGLTRLSGIDSGFIRLDGVMEGLQPTIDEVKDALSDISTSLSDIHRVWWRGTAKRIQDILKSRGVNGSNQYLNSYEQAELITAQIYLGEEFHKQEGTIQTIQMDRLVRNYINRGI